MKYSILLIAFSFSLLSNSECSKKTSSIVYHGKLEIKGICMNYTISMQGENINPDLVVPNWTDPTTGNNYQNVFRLGSPCTFPAEINQGDEFDFIVDSSPKQDCIVCMAFYPTPEKRLAIKVVKK